MSAIQENPDLEDPIFLRHAIPHKEDRKLFRSPPSAFSLLPSAR